MHAILFQLALIPLTVSKGFLAWISVNTSVAQHLLHGSEPKCLHPAKSLSTSIVQIRTRPHGHPNHRRRIAVAANTTVCSGALTSMSLLQTC